MSHRSVTNDRISAFNSIVAENTDVLEILDCAKDAIARGANDRELRRLVQKLVESKGLIDSTSRRHSFSHKLNSFLLRSLIGRSGTFQAKLYKSFLDLADFPVSELINAAKEDRSVRLPDVLDGVIGSATLAEGVPVVCLIATPFSVPEEKARDFIAECYCAFPAEASKRPTTLIEQSKIFILYSKHGSYREVAKRTLSAVLSDLKTADFDQYERELAREINRVTRQRLAFIEHLKNLMTFDSGDTEPKT